MRFTFFISFFLSFFLNFFCCCCCCCDYTQYSWFFSRNLSMRVQETPCHYLFLGRICLHYEIHGIDLIAPINKLFYFESVAHGMVLCMCDLNLNWCPPCTKCVCVWCVCIFNSCSRATVAHTRYWKRAVRFILSCFKPFHVERLKWISSQFQSIRFDTIRFGSMRDFCFYFVFCFLLFVHLELPKNSVDI